MVVRRELLRGLRRLSATTTVLQRARLADPLHGMWEAADVQWWWRRPRATDELALPVWFDREMVETRLRQCSLYDPALDLAVEAADGRIAGYALFWFDPVTLVGLLEPMRVEDDYQRRGLARMLLTNGLDRLGRKGARRAKVGFETDAARDLYLGAGFVQTSVDRMLVRAR